jgi:anion-transporting  ArsA/GET3 family ATPase
MLDRLVKDSPGNVMKLRLLLLSLLATVAMGQAEAQIYRWVDAQGQVHFEQRPRPGAEPVEVRPQVVEREDHVRESEQNRQRLYDVREQERAEQRELNAQLRQQQTQRCARLREQLALYDKRVFWYEEDASGRRVEVPNDRVQAGKNALLTQLREGC